MMRARLLYLLLSIAALSGSPQNVSAAIFVNCGGENYTDFEGNLWVADSVTNFYNTGITYTTPTAPINGTDDDILYLTGRWDHRINPEMKYEIPLVDGEYNITLHFSETFEKTMAPSKRIFDVWVGGSLIFENLDILAEVGGFVALRKSVTTSVSDGFLSIEFRHVIQSPTISGIEIHELAKDPQPLESMYLNIGGPNFVDLRGTEWVADNVTKYYNTGHPFKGSKVINGTYKDELFRTMRFDSADDVEMKYEIPLEDGTYDVFLYFAETYSKTQGPGLRLFNVWMEGSLIFKNLDVFSEAGGGFTPLSKKAIITVTGGGLTIEFEHVKQNPFLSGIEIHKSVIQGAPPSFLNLPTQPPQPPQAPSTIPTSMPSMFMSFDPILINVGGNNYTDIEGNLWVADTVTKYFNTGSTSRKNVTVNGTEDEVLYQSDRWDVFNGPPMTYNIPVPGGTYDVFLHFAEIYTKAQAPKKRVFDVYIENELIYENFDIYKEARGYTALIKETMVTVTDGILTIEFGHKISNPKICAIEIRLAPPSSAPSITPSTSSQPSAPTNSPIPSAVPSLAPSMFPTETLLPWIDMDESNDYIARHECSFVQAGNKFYLFGGRESPEKLDIYDYTHNTWAHGALAPKPFNHFQAVTYEGLIWVIGAFQTNNFPDEEPQENVYVYDPANNIWMEGPKIPWPRGAGGLVVYKDKFYLVGGNSAGHDGGFVAWMDEYDPVSGKWKLLKNAAQSRDHFHAAVLGDRLYAIGGRRTIRGNTLGDTVKEVDVYDFATRQWLTTDLPRDVPLPRASAAVAVFDGKIMVIGGETAKQTLAHARVDALDPTNGRWSSLRPLHYRRHGTQAIVSGEGVYVVGGSPNRGGGQQRSMEVYNLDAPEGEESRPGVLGVLSDSGGLVTLQHIGGNQGVFLNSIVLTGPAASDLKIKTETTSRILIRKNGLLTLSVEYIGAADKATAQMVVTYSGNKELNISVTATNSNST